MKARVRSADQTVDKRIFPYVTGVTCAAQCLALYNAFNFGITKRIPRFVDGLHRTVAEFAAEYPTGTHYSTRCHLMFDASKRRLEEDYRYVYGSFCKTGDRLEAAETQNFLWICALMVMSDKFGWKLTSEHGTKQSLKVATFEKAYCDVVKGLNRNFAHGNDCDYAFDEILRGKLGRFIPKEYIDSKIFKWEELENGNEKNHANAACREIQART